MDKNTTAGSTASAQNHQIKIPALIDSFPLSATLWSPPKNSSIKKNQIVVIAPATGVPGRFYTILATYLSQEKHLTVLVFDYRFCGTSFPNSNLNAESRIEALKSAPEVGKVSHWGKRDVAGILTWVFENHPDKEVLYLGHSVGGHVFPLLEQAHKVTRALFVSVGCPFTGYWEQPDLALHSAKNNIESWRELGFSKLSNVGMGNDIPLQAGVDWMTWLQSPRYIASVPEHAEIMDNYKVPTLSICFADDMLCAPETIIRYLALLPQLDGNVMIIDPKDVGVTAVGHVNGLKTKQCFQIYYEWLSNGRIVEKVGEVRSTSYGRRPTHISRLNVNNVKSAL